MTGDLRSDIAEARARMKPGTAAGLKSEIALLEQRLEAQERVLHLSSAFFGGGAGVLACTTERLLYLEEKRGKRQHLFDWRYRAVRDVEWRPGMLTGGLTIIAGADQYVVKNVQKDLGPQMVEEFRQRRAAPPRTHAPVTPAEPTPSADPAQGDIIDQIRRLSELHDLGIITDDEFLTKKAELLSRL